jgi:hypothetical protein
VRQRPRPRDIQKTPLDGLDQLVMLGTATASVTGRRASMPLEGPAVALLNLQRQRSVSCVRNGKTSR